MSCNFKLILRGGKLKKGFRLWSIKWFGESTKKCIYFHLKASIWLSSTKLTPYMLITLQKTKSKLFGTLSINLEIRHKLIKKRERKMNEEKKKDREKM